MSRQCKVVIKPTVKIGRVPTIVESIIPKLFDGDNTLEFESIVNDKKKFFYMRMEITKFLSPIVERISRGREEVALGIQLFDDGNLKIYQLSKDEFSKNNDTIDGV